MGGGGAGRPRRSRMRARSRWTTRSGSAFAPSATSTRAPDPWGGLHGRRLRFSSSFLASASSARTPKRDGGSGQEDRARRSDDSAFAILAASAGTAALAIGLRVAPLNHSAPSSPSGKRSTVSWALRARSTVHWWPGTGELSLYKDGPLGVIQEGTYADLLVVDGSPLEDISLLADPAKNLKLIMKDGKIYKDTAR